jgi:NADH-quinone oxidoreductase subunit L
MLGTLDFVRIDHLLGVQKIPLDPLLVTAATLLLFVGATGKSAQIPLYIWLPDAMAGPTPVSALIHAATMVTAGIYMIVRLASLFTLSPTTMGIIAAIGAATALLAASIAIVQNDIKKVLAYSTVSQLGYMFLAVGVGAFTAGVFHLMTHAFFKALLFLGSGAVIHAMDHAHGADDPQDIRTMGGLWKPLRITAITFLIGTMAIAGIPGLSGFFSKDEVLWKALSSEYGGVGLWLVGVLVAGMTAFYMSRLFIRTFLGAYRGREGTADHLHDSPWQMSTALIVLAVLSVFAGYLGLPHIFHVPNLLEEWLSPVLRYSRPIRGYHHVAMGPVSIGEWAAMGVSVAVASAGIAAAWFLYIKRPELPAVIAARLRPAYLLLAGKWFVDEVYEWLIIRPLHLVSRYVLFGLVDRRLIDFAVEGSGRLARGAGEFLRTAQTGKVGTYLLYLLAGSLALVVLAAGR